MTVKSNRFWNDKVILFERLLLLTTNINTNEHTHKIVTKRCEKWSQKNTKNDHKNVQNEP